MTTVGSVLGLLAGGAATGSAVIGLYIGYHAYRGLRRHDEPSMRYLSIGMILLFGVTYVLALAGQGLIAFRVVPIDLQNTVRLVVRAVQLAGLVCIAYSLRVATGR
ncbi:hypothetical protein ACFQE8_15475 [Salinirubellus sp. GCM10025818]|jgi:hypothetical protein|uniref:DUF7521 family protein n=1 Tax=Salinirubellus TaxID=2162630 RepID=UPI0030D14D4C